MLSKKKRLTKDIFDKIMKEGNIIVSSFYIFRYIIQKEPRYSVVVPKKVLKSAVLRNKNKRKTYNILRNININKNAGIFFYKKEGIVENNLILKADINNIISKMK